MVPTMHIIFYHQLKPHEHHEHKGTGNGVTAINLSSNEARASCSLTYHRPSEQQLGSTDELVLSLILMSPLKGICTREVERL